METISNKLQSHILKPQFYQRTVGNELCCAEISISMPQGDSQSFLRLQAQVDNNALLNIGSFESNLSQEAIGFVDALLHLIDAREFFMIADTSVRELESFLRDRNDCQAYLSDQLSIEGLDSLTLRFVQRVVAKLVGKSLANEIKQKFSKQLPVMDCGHLFEKINLLNSIKEAVYRPILKKFHLDLEFTELWGNDLYYQLILPKHRDSSHMRGFFHEVFVASNPKASLNWVAEPQE